MPRKFDRFTDRARLAMTFAKQEAERLLHDYIGTEHILLGLVRVKEGVAAQVLQNLKIDLEMIRKEVGRLTKPAEAVNKQNPLPFTPQSRRVLDFAIKESTNMQNNFVGTEHMLLGLIREEEGIAAQVLINLGMDLEAVRKEVMEFASSASETPIIPPQESKPEYAPVGAGPQQQGPQAPKTAKKTTPALDSFGRDLTAMAKQGLLDPMIGRSNELERVLQVLVRRTKCNPVLIGEAGVGKTAIAEGLAQMIAGGTAPRVLAGKRVIALDLAMMVAGTKYRGQFEERMKMLLQEIARERNIVLFIDELHTMIGAGSAEGSMDACNLLKPALARGELHCIGATTLNEFRKYVEKDDALARRFQPVFVNEPTQEDAIEILKGLRHRYEDHHKVKITDEAVSEAVRLSARYVTGRFLPDKAIDVIDEGGSRVRLSSGKIPQELLDLEALLKQMEKDKERTVACQKFELAAELRDRIEKTREAVTKSRVALDSSTEYVGSVDKEIVREVVAKMTGVPVGSIADDEGKRLIDMEKSLHERVVSQDEAIQVVADAIRRARAGLKDPKRPIANLMFLGPTGVGKTLLAKALAAFMFGSEESLIQIDMSEYMEQHAVSRLIGSPPGYVGYDEGGQLTEKIRRRPYSIVLFDEIEKAHPDAFSILLQIMEDGRLTDGLGRTVDFRNAVIIMTSNVGARLAKARSMGFAKTGDAASYEGMRNKIKEEVEREFKPEFINRLDEMVVFRPLSQEEILRIVDIELSSVQKRLDIKHITLSVSDAAKKFLSEKGYNPDMGARPLRRAILTHVENPLSSRMLKGDVPDGATILVGVENDALTFETAKPKKPRQRLAKAAEPDGGLPVSPGA